MNYTTLFLICLVIAANGAPLTFTYGTTQCSCDEYTSNTDCGTQPNKCEWVSNACSAIDCTKKGTTVTDCNKNGCALNTSKTCETKTSCANYKYDAKDSCTAIGCDAGDKGTDNLYPCKDYTASTITNACSSFKAQNDCTTAECKWSGTTCGPNLCSDITTSAQCTNIRGEDYKTRTICSWDATKTTCSDATTGLVQSNCASYTAGTYSWNADDSKCEACTGDSYAKIIIVTATVLLSLF